MTTSLLIDIGNSRIKWARAGSQGLHGHGTFDYERPGDDAAQAQLLREVMAQLPGGVEAAVVVSVARQELAQGIAEGLRRASGMSVRLARVQRVFAGLTVGYTHTLNLGVDRWVAMLGAGRLVGFPCTVIDFGTAVTVDAVDAEGRHLGGAIAPGRTLQRRSLRQSTAQIRAGQGEPVPPSIFARDTGEAVAAGVDHGLAALVGLAHTSTRQHLGADACQRQGPSWPPLLVTGGDAAALLPLLPAHAQHVDDLVLEGARVLLDAPEEIP